MLTYPIKGPWPGELAIIPRPRRDDWLEDEARNLRTAGFDVVVSFLTSDEEKELGLDCEEKVVRGQGLQFCKYPIPDLGTPASRQSAREFLAGLHQLLLEGKKIGLHCRGSIGRSGLAASSVLVLAGVESSRAIHEVTAARGCIAPETAEQRDWVMTLLPEPVALPA